MKLSIIIPFQKGLMFLKDCLDSLVEQTFREMEIILVCDNVQEDLEVFLVPYQSVLDIKVHHLEERTGVAAARNHGITFAAGEYIYFLDSDDYIGNNTLELLVTSADQNNSDLVYGKLVYTWLKRSVFMETIESDENTQDEGEEDEDSSDSGQSTSDSDSSDEGDSSITKNKNKEKSIEDDDGESNDTAKKQAYSQLVSKRSGVRNITVLNILFRRSFLNKTGIKFKEDIIYISDYPYLLQVLQAAENFESQPQAIYMKHIYEEPGYPSLGERKGSKSFWEYTDAYLYTIHQLDDDNLIERLDRKIINYCVKFFAPKLKEKKNIAVRKQKFGIMQKILRGMDEKLINEQKGYYKKVIVAFINGNDEKVMKVIDRHVKWTKFQNLFKYNRSLAKFLYQHAFFNKPMKDNWVFMESFFGKSYSDSPKYIFEYMSKKYPGQYKFIWVINKNKVDIPYPHVKVKRFSIRYAYYLSRSKYYIFNGRQPDWIKKKKGNVFLETWHGTPLKRLVYDQENISAATPRYKRQVYVQSRIWDYLIAPNKFSSDIFRRCFKFDKEMLETGYPRNDILHDENREQIAEKIKAGIGIPKGKKTILYAPTWRDDEYYTKGRYKFSLKLDMQLLREKLGEEYVVLLRTHYFIADKLDVTGLEDFAFNLSNYDDIAELYLISDILITDYSSVFFDYANLKRPMMFYTYDLEKYRDVLRGFYIDIEEELPGPLLFTTEEIIHAIVNLKDINEQYQQKYTAFYEKYCSWEDGQASRRVSEAVFQLESK